MSKLITEETNYMIQKFLSPLQKIISSNIDYTDISLNANGKIFATKNNMEVDVYNSPYTENDVYRIAVYLASLHQRELNEKTPFVSATINNGLYRFEILTPPIVENVCFSLRIQKRNKLTLEKLIELGMLTNFDANILTECINKRKNIIISGETGSGKTTLLNALIDKISLSERLLVIEEGTREITSLNENVVYITVNNNYFTGKDAVMSALRMNPDRIIYGEIRDGMAALNMLKALNTGHKGTLCTIHANSAHDIENRMSQLLSEVTQKDNKYFITEFLDTKVHISVLNNKRILSEIIWNI